MAYSTVPRDYAPTEAGDNPGEHTRRSVTYCSRGHSEVELEGLSCTHSGNPPFTPVPDTKLETDHSNQSREFKPTNRHRKAPKFALTLWLTLFLPAVAFAYLAFCYVAATRLVPVRIWMVDQPMEHLYGIKAGVTTLNIIIVAIALLPLKTLIDIKSEEFFRALHKSTLGIPLKDVNDISIPSHTLFHGLRSIARNRASKYYTGAIISGVTAAIVSSLAPAALSVGLVATDSDITAIQVGAIRIDSVIDVENLSASDLFEARTGEAASRGWVQNVLGAEIAFTPTSPRYAVPVPLNLGSTAHARYITDVVILDPVCRWSVPDAPLVTFFKAPSTLPRVWVNLTSPGVGLEMSGYDTYWVRKKYLDVAGSGSIYLRTGLKNLSTSDPVTDGTMAWIIAQCTSCDFQNELIPESALDLSEIPTQDFSFNKTDTISNTTTFYTTRLSALVCKPHASVETREVHLDGNGKLHVMEYSGLVRQGNLHLGQTQLMLAYGLLRYTTDSGHGKSCPSPDVFWPNLGNSTTTPLLKPQSAEKITAQYRLAQQAALRSYLSGEIASSFVPGRVQVMKLVFTSSLPHIVASTILFASVALFINLCYLRSETDQFTLFSVATVLARSNVGAACEDAKYLDRTEEPSLLVNAGIGMVGDRRLYLAHNGGPGPVLQME